MDAYILNFNNYFNRQVKRFDTVNEYLDSDPYFDVSKNINFNPADGITASLTFNTAKNGNYLLIVDPYEYAIVSRWFIMEQKYQRNGQCTLTLRRDVVSDFYRETINAPCFMEKAKLSNSDPMIFNSEGMSFNRIKVNEIPLKDETKVGWIVGYTQKTSLTADSINFTGETNYISVASISSWDYHDYVDGTKKWRVNPHIYMGGRISVFSNYFLCDGNETVKKYITSITSAVLSWNQWTPNANMSAFISRQTTKNLLCNYLDVNNGEADDSEYLELDGKLIKDETTGTFYKIHIVTSNERKSEVDLIPTAAGTLYVGLKDAIIADLGNPTTSVGSLIYRMLYNESYITLEETANVSGDLNIDANPTFLHKAEDADYCIFVIPCPKKGEMYTFINPTTQARYPFTYEKSMAMAQMLIRQLQPSSSGGNLLDIQLLPYCPITYADDYYEKLNYKDSNGNIVGSAYCLKKSSFTKTIDTSITIDDPKISNECDLYRLVSPNYASSFEFSPAKNGGVLFFHVNCTYKPYSPYINIHPNFGYMYGSDYDDNRGLILAGDFSLPVTSDAFLSYQIQNKNYSNIFDRQMQNLDKQNAWGMANAVGGAVAGTVQGAAMGAMAGPYGAIAGGIASGIGGALDITQSAMMMAENKDLQKDMYAYQLGNIDSKPNSLVKSSSFDISFKMWPFIEYCTCTDEEKKALRDKLTYNGMTVMRIGTISEFLENGSSFVKGQIIRLENLAEDNHLAGEIYNEIAKGVYF